MLLIGPGNCNLAFTQIKKDSIITNRFSINPSIIKTGANISGNLAVSLSVESKRHCFNIGTKFLMNRQDNTGIAVIGRYTESFGDRIGFVAGYQWHPNKYFKRKIDIYFETLSMITFFRLGYKISGSPFYLQKVKVGKEYLFEQLIGYGFKINIRKRYYINYSMGGSLALIFNKFDDHADFNNYFGTSSIYARLGVGYNFYSFKF